MTTNSHLCFSHFISHKNRRKKNMRFCVLLHITSCNYVFYIIWLHYSEVNCYCHCRQKSVAVHLRLIAHSITWCGLHIVRVCGSKLVHVLQQASKLFLLFMQMTKTPTLFRVISSVRLIRQKKTICGALCIDHHMGNFSHQNIHPFCCCYGNTEFPLILLPLFLYYSKPACEE